MTIFGSAGPWRGGICALTLALAACQDLNVPNLNAPDRERALAQAADLEALIAGTWRTLWGRLHVGSSTYNPMPLVGDEMTATFANDGALELSSEPRPVYNNNSTSSVAGAARFPWEDFNEILSSASEALAALDRGVVLDSSGVDHTARGRAFAKFMQGVGLGYLGMMFDRAYIIDETTDIEGLVDQLPEASPYTAVRDEAISRLEQAIAYMEDPATPDFRLPTTWIEGLALTKADLIRLAHSYIARLLVYTCRCPGEREAVDWNRVLYHVDPTRSISADHAPILASGVLTSNYWFRVQNSGSFQSKADYKLIGPSDNSGNYQTWLNTSVPQRTKFLITTPDRRITGATPTSSGTYFRYISGETFRVDRGTYHFTFYQWYRRGGNSTTGPGVIMSKAEMDLLRAEALYRLGRLDEAAAEISKTRVANGQLPAVTAAGVPQDTLGYCVPRKNDGTCGDLFDALMYERMIELAGFDAIRTYLDRRGFGTLVEGTFLHFPIPGRELETLGQPLYTFGGVGGQWAAPCP
jgi:hypothetical protein